MSTNDSNTEAPVQVKGVQIAANRENAKKSTGPKSAAGKALVAMNSVAHGIYSVSPVIEDMESARDWKRYRAAMLTSLAPVGMLETTLAERIILTGWRQRRVARYETEQIRLTQEGAKEHVGKWEFNFDKNEADKAVEEILSGAEWRRRTWGSLERFAEANDGDIFSERDSEDLLGQFHDHLGLETSLGDYWQQLPEQEAWTVGLIRQLVRSLADQHGKNFDDLLAAIRQKATVEFVQYGRAANKVKHELDVYRRENLLPDDETLERIQRYEAHLSRMFHRDLHELQRLQAIRQGQPVAAPMTIDIDVATGPNPATAARE